LGNHKWLFDGIAEKCPFGTFIFKSVGRIFHNVDICNFAMPIKCWETSNQQQFLIEKVCAPSFPRNHFGNDMRIDWRNVGPRKHSQTDAISCWFNTEEIIFNSRAQSYHPLI